jgi:hypothetical protein
MTIEDLKIIIKDILIDELEYTKYEADVTTEDLLNLDDSLIPVFAAWLKDRTITDIEISKTSLVKLMRENSLKFPSALITLDWLTKDPETAKKALSVYMEGRCFS